MFLFDQEDYEFHPEDLEEFNNLLDEINNESDISESEFSLDQNQMLSVESLEGDLLLPKIFSDLFEVCKRFFKSTYRNFKNLKLETGTAECVSILSINIHTLLNFAYHSLKFLVLLSYFTIKCAIFIIQKMLQCKM